jgi:hypothetical protein
MSLDIHARHTGFVPHPAAPTGALAADSANFRVDWGQQIRTIVATSITVPIVAVIAVLIGIICLLTYAAYNTISIIYALNWLQDDYAHFGRTSQTNSGTRR